MKAVNETPIEDVDLLNFAIVGATGEDQVVMLRPPVSMSRDQALVLAAYLVSIADPLRERFDGIYERVISA